MICRILVLLSFVALPFLTVSAQDAIISYPDRNSFSAAARDLTVNDFEGIVPNSGFKQYQREGSLRYAGTEFRPGGGERFGPGPVIVVGGWYQGGPAYETTSGAKLHWAPPNQPGNASLDITLPGRTTAVGMDIWTVQPLEATLDVVVTTSDGKSHTQSVNTPRRPTPGFIGFTSDSAITSLRITPRKGQTGLIIDNFTIGKSSGERPAVSTAQPEMPSPERSNRPPVENPGNTNPTMPAGPGRTSSSGVIAYLRNSTEIRLIDPDGSNDRQLWTSPDLSPELGIFEMEWKPDGTELAFSSPHEAAASPYLADIYSIGRDGSNLKRLTNPPARGALAPFPKGSVTVNVTNIQAPSYSPGNFIIYVEGASEGQKVFIASGTSKAITFNSVADFGKRPQMVVAMSGPVRWFVPGVDVVAGRSVTAPPFQISGKGYEMHGAFRPSWRADGSRISFRSGLCVVSSVSTKAAPGSSAYDPFFGGKQPGGACAWDWGPTPATANQVIYTDNSSGGSNIFQMTEGGTHPGTKLTAFSDLDYQHVTDLHWIPDGSGLLYSTINKFRDASNIFRYDFASKTTTQVTKLEREFAREFSISPDSQTVVYQRCSDRDAEVGCDLWTVGTDGRGARLLVKNGLRPAWGK